MTSKDDARINCPHFQQNIRLYQSSYFITCQLAFNLPIFTNLKMRNIFFWEKKYVFKDLTQSSLRPFYDSLILYIGYLSFPRVILFSKSNKFWRLEWQSLRLWLWPGKKWLNNTETLLCYLFLVLQHQTKAIRSGLLFCSDLITTFPLNVLLVSSANWLYYFCPGIENF